MFFSFTGKHTSTIIGGAIVGTVALVALVIATATVMLRKKRYIIQ